jgi:hypothetical protein
MFLAEQGDRAGALNYVRQGIGRAQAYLSTDSGRELGAPRIPKSYYVLGSVCRTLAKDEAQMAAQSLADWRDARSAAGRAISECRKLTSGAKKHPYARDIVRAEVLLSSRNFRQGCRRRRVKSV